MKKKNGKIFCFHKNKNKVESFNEGYVNGRYYNHMKETKECIKCGRTDIRNIVATNTMINAQVLY